MRTRNNLKALCLMMHMLLAGAIQPLDVIAGDWPNWRGPYRNGVSMEIGLVSQWSQGGENVIWKADFAGRSTPIVMNGRVYVIGRTGMDITEQEHVACYDARTGALLWEHKFNVFHTTVPFNRVGWASLEGDPETGYIYAHGVSGLFFCYDRDGNIIWSRSLTEEFNSTSGYGGRTHTPFVDGDLVIISFVSSSGWGNQGPPRHRYFAFDKRTGDVVWISAPGTNPLDTTYSSPVVAVIGGQRLLIAGNADGWIYAMKVRTGEPVWRFHLSKRGINSSIVVDGDRVYAAHSEENIDNTSMGRVVCIDATDTGDITGTGEIWRYDAVTVGYTAPVAHDNRIYVVDNSSNMLCLNASTGALYWQYSLGTVGKGSPVWADGKLYATEVNGKLHILQPGERSCEPLDVEQIDVPEGRYAEIYGSPAIAYGRVYFTTEEGLYCLGNRNAPFSATPSMTPAAAEPPPDRQAAPAHIQVVPAEVLIKPGETVAFKARAFDGQGRYLRDVTPDWSMNGISGMINAGGAFTSDAQAGAQAGTLVAQVGGTQGAARVRIIPELPWSEDFDATAVGEGRRPAPSHWLGSAGKFFVERQGGNQVLVKTMVDRGMNRSSVFLGPHTMSNYTVQADMMGTRYKRNMPDMGLIANRYTLNLLGNHQWLQIYSWASDLRMAKQIDFKWAPDVWYTMKMRVDMVGEKAIVRGKVWRTGEPEPEEWTIAAEDPLPNRVGSPGIYGYSSAEIFYDNVKVIEN